MQFARVREASSVAVLSRERGIFASQIFKILHTMAAAAAYALLSRTYRTVAPRC